MSEQTCVHGCLVKLDPVTYQRTIVPVTCGKWTCPFCRRHKQYDWVQRILSGKPTRWLTLTMPGAPTGNSQEQFVTLKKAWVQIVRLIRQKTTDFEYVSFYELQARGSPHVHVMFRGHFIAKKWLSAVAVRLGLGEIVHIGAIRDAGHCASYCAKYITKAADQTRTIVPNVRIVAASNHFFPKSEKPELPLFPEESHWSYHLGSPQSVADYYVNVDRASILEKHTDGTIILSPDAIGKHLLACAAARSQGLPPPSLKLDSSKGTTQRTEELPFEANDPRPRGPFSTASPPRSGRAG